MFANIPVCKQWKIKVVLSAGAVQMLCVDNVYTAKQMFVCVMLYVGNILPTGLAWCVYCVGGSPPSELAGGRGEFSQTSLSFE